MSNKTINEKLREAGIELDSHASDLYALKTPESEKIIAGHEFACNVTIFRSQIDGRLWFDIPFANDYWWQNRGMK